MKLKNADLVCFKTRQWQVISQTQILPLEDYCAYLPLMRFNQFHGCARSNVQVFIAVPRPRWFRLMQVYELTVCERFTFGNVC